MSAFSDDHGFGWGAQAYCSAGCFRSGGTLDTTLATVREHLENRPTHAIAMLVQWYPEGERHHVYTADEFRAEMARPICAHCRHDHAPGEKCGDVAPAIATCHCESPNIRRPFSADEEEPEAPR